MWGQMGRSPFFAATARQPSAAEAVPFPVKVKIKINYDINVKGVGQECPTHTGGMLGLKPAWIVGLYAAPFGFAQGRLCPSRSKSKSKGSGRGRPLYTR